jgi:hypothetical protein
VNVVTGQLKLGSDDGRLITLPAGQFEKVENRWRIKGGIGGESFRPEG